MGIQTRDMSNETVEREDYIFNACFDEYFKTARNR